MLSNLAGESLPSFHPNSQAFSVSTVLLPILVITIPVLAIVLLAVGGRRLSGSCGGMNPDGSCQRCGKTAGEPEPAGGACSR
jgi:hypothetical protein